MNLIFNRILPRIAKVFAIAVLAWTISFVDQVALAGNKEISFSREVRPIFEQKCYPCHGPEKQESQYRLDVKSTAIEGGDFGEAAIVPGKSERSPLWRYVAGLDPEIVMPPKGKRLASSELHVIKEWINQGSHWPDELAGNDVSSQLTTNHWSFQPLRLAAPPATSHIACSNPIDLFVLKKLKDVGLSMSSEADRKILARRSFLDMHGLLPTPAQAAEFINDTHPAAYERLVDRLLASPRYGERWARHWLDVVRFAETNGFETNTPRPTAYHYRDYVIDAFNSNKPYDRFLFEQIAGDSVGIDAATGFLVGGAWDQVKSPDINLTLMQRQDELADMINTTGTAFMGLTLGCARCHNHKFDPVLQKDYYSFQAVFAGVQHGKRPLREAHLKEQRLRAKEVKKQIEKIRELLEPYKSDLNEKVNPERNIDSFSPVKARYVRFSILETNQSEPCIDELEIWSVGDDRSEPKNVALTGFGTKVSSSGDYLGNSKHRLEHINDGQFGNDRSWISDEVGKGWVKIEFPLPFEIDQVIWGRDRTKQYVDRLATKYRIEIAINPNQWQEVSSSKSRIPFDKKNDIHALYQFSNVSPADAELARMRLKRLHDLSESYKKLISTSDATVYAGIFEQPPKTHRLYRGDPLQKREVVVPDALSVMGSLNLSVDTPEQQRRIALADWLIRKDNPLTARVIVNRLWQYHFGMGIVNTSSDFGGNGAKPTHPRLLDWLAKELIRTDWSIKHLHRLILTSRTYRQLSRPRPEAIAIDADSRFLWRFPPRRLEAEAIRDTILQMSGVLDLRMHGPGYTVFQPNENYVRVYLPKEKYGPDEWRRMIYCTKVRMERDVIFGAFDTPDAGQACPKRGRSTTAIQALNLLNSGFVAHQAELLARRVIREVGTQLSSQVKRVFEITFGRTPDKEEAELAKVLVKDHGLPALCRAVFNANEFLFIP